MPYGLPINLPTLLLSKYAPKEYKTGLCEQMVESLIALKSQDDYL